MWHWPAALAGITITATTPGNTATDTITVTRDNTNPTLTVTTPAVNPFYTTAGTVALGGTASDASGITQVQYRVNGGGPDHRLGHHHLVGGLGHPWPPCPRRQHHRHHRDGRRHQHHPGLDHGHSRHHQSRGGHHDERRRQLHHHATPVALAARLRTTSFVSSVTCRTTGGAVNSASGTTSWTASIPLTAGSNAITVKATDAAGNFATTSITVTLGPDPAHHHDHRSDVQPDLRHAGRVPHHQRHGDGRGGGTVASVNWSTSGAVATTTGATTLGAALQLHGGDPAGARVAGHHRDGDGQRGQLLLRYHHRLQGTNAAPTLSITTPATNPFYTTAASVALAGIASDNKSPCRS